MTRRSWAFVFIPSHPPRLKYATLTLAFPNTYYGMCMHTVRNLDLFVSFTVSPFSYYCSILCICVILGC
ncbi:hypothetical protein PILCRDRAFT_822443 [Piloderma croceum F 1598]|uniref:Uncharacterized protein n=1 Tax=Piloderma croceum (strain F 1598) TaxID=765440 RepID=A0A0C3BSK2_PILCF|nr:hypothetical protein PILCRDRAFT_822443 [Piloderma croceum F 1598]